MDLHLRHAAPTDEERAAVDALLGAPSSAWDGGARGNPLDGHVSYVGGRTTRENRHMLLSALRALQARVGWVSETGIEYVCARLGVPPADAWGVATFYALLSTTPRAPRVLHVCDDIACRCKGAAELIEQIERTLGPAHAHAPNGEHVSVDPNGTVWMRSPCLGMCDHAPAAFVQQAGVEAVESLVAEMTVEKARGLASGAVIPNEQRESRNVGSLRTVASTSPDSSTALGMTTQIPQRGQPSLRLLRRVGVVDPESIAAYGASGGFDALRRAIEIGAERVIDEVIASKLMGRGGAAFPTGKKWEAVAKQVARPHYLICNADESEPGTFKDRVLLDGDPFAIVEAMTIAGFATACERGFVYIRGEYPLGAARMQHAIDQSRAQGFLGQDILGTGITFEIEIRRGAGAYICGEETAIFNSIEGYRGEPRNKPPFPAQAGLFGLPTVVNNVETLANIPLIVLEGGAPYASIGTALSTGPKLFCVSGNVTKPGVYEVPFGATLREMLEMAGGVAHGRALQAILLGGAAGVFVGPNELDIPLTFEGARAANATLGSGVIVAFDDTVDMTQILLRIASFFRDESCGQCVPCRVGTVRQEEALHRIALRKPIGGVAREIALLDEVGLAMKDASICGLGQTAYAAIESAIHRVGVLNSK